MDKTNEMTVAEALALYEQEKAERLREQQKRAAAEAALRQSEQKRQDLKRGYDLAKEQVFQLEMQQKALQSQLEAFRSGAKVTSLRNDYRRAVQKLKKRIRELEHQIAQADRDLKKMRDEWSTVYDMVAKEERSRTRAAEKGCEKAWQQARQAERTAERYRDQARESARQKYEAETKAERLESQNLNLQRQLGQDFETSGIPSSAREFKPGKKKNIPNSRPKTNRSRGGQPGRKGVTLKPRAEGDIPTVWLEVPEEISQSDEWYETSEEVTRQVQDIEVRVVVTNYKAKVWRNRRTGSRYHAEFPQGIQNPANYGSTLKSLMLYLSEFCNVPGAKVCELIGELTGGEIRPSGGMAASLCRQFQRRSAAEQREAYVRIQASPYVHIDSTVFDIEGTRHCVTICLGPGGIYYVYTDHKGCEAGEATPVGQCSYQGCLIHDEESTFFKYGQSDKHQLCWVHLERRAKDSVNWEKDRKWNHAFLEWLTSTIHLRKQQQGKLSPEQLAEIRQRYDEIIALGEQEYDYDPVPEDGYKHGRNLLKTLRERRESVLNCLDKPWLPHHNNPAEGGLRPIKRHTRAAVTNRSREEAHAYCAFLTVIKTADIQGKRVFPLIKEIMSRPAPRSKASLAMQFGSPTRKPSDSRPAA